ncbi:nuclear nucleic acid-binding protein C1D isoform X3 [Protopterus annectens]|uniref:nuclear nucleic acid-binding protein C1D isoform X3 n=1 Tax=Protopterus annectens TaxID=7888 RepID=UPI001CFBF197|nr:nuclear nucleic acid-binding protein C1D isoform X3 [Protopterus annectens]
MTSSLTSLRNKMEEEALGEDYPMEIHEYLAAFEGSLDSLEDMLNCMMSVSRSDLQKLDPLEQAKLDLVSAYTLNSLFWVYLITQGVNPKEHPVKQELVLWWGSKEEAPIQATKEQGGGQNKDLHE